MLKRIKEKTIQAWLWITVPFRVLQLLKEIKELSEEIIQLKQHIKQQKKRIYSKKPN